jgi:hypothetical protein
VRLLATMVPSCCVTVHVSILCVSVRHSLDAKMVFSSWEELASLERIADAVVIATQVLSALWFAPCHCRFIQEHRNDFVTHTG